MQPPYEELVRVRGYIGSTKVPSSAVDFWWLRSS